MNPRPPSVPLELDAHELARERLASQIRLKNSWESIIERYSHDFEGVADEIDTVTGEIVVDNGHLRALVEQEGQVFDWEGITGIEAAERVQETTERGGEGREAVGFNDTELEECKECKDRDELDGSVCLRCRGRGVVLSAKSDTSLPVPAEAENDPSEEEESGGRALSGEAPIMEESGEAPTMKESGEAPITKESGEAPITKESGEAPIAEESGEASITEESREAPGSSTDTGSPTKASPRNYTPPAPLVPAPLSTPNTLLPPHEGFMGQPVFYTPPVGISPTKTPQTSPPNYSVPHLPEDVKVWSSVKLAEWVVKNVAFELEAGEDEEEIERRVIYHGITGAWVMDGILQFKHLQDMLGIKSFSRRMELWDVLRKLKAKTLLLNLPSSPSLQKSSPVLPTPPHPTAALPSPLKEKPTPTQHRKPESRRLLSPPPLAPVFPKEPHVSVHNSGPKPSPPPSPAPTPLPRRLTLSVRKAPKDLWAQPQSSDPFYSSVWGDEHPDGTPRKFPQRPPEPPVFLTPAPQKRKRLSAATEKAVGWTTSGKKRKMSGQSFLKFGANSEDEEDELATPMSSGNRSSPIERKRKVMIARRPDATPGAAPAPVRDEKGQEHECRAKGFCFECMGLEGEEDDLA